MFLKAKGNAIKVTFEDYPIREIVVQSEIEDLNTIYGVFFSVFNELTKENQQESSLARKEFINYA